MIDAHDVSLIVMIAVMLIILFLVVWVSRP